MNTSFRATLNLLNSSSIVAIAGSLRLYVAFLFAGIAQLPLLIIAEGLVVYSTYLFDRALSCEEDAINRKELVGANKRVGILASVIAFGTGAVIFTLYGAYLAAFLPLLIGYLYSKGIPLGKKVLKLKGGYGRKNVVIGTTWGANIAFAVAAGTDVIPALLAIFLFFGGKLFISSTLFDFKDVKGDCEAGIITLPVFLGEALTKKVLLGTSFLLYGVMVVSILAGTLRPEVAILACSFLFTVVFIGCYSLAFEERASGIKKHFRQIMVAGEMPAALISKAVADALIH